MRLLDSDVVIDLLRAYPPAVAWFDTLAAAESLYLPGYVMMELLQGCRNKTEQAHLERALGSYGIVWLMPADCERALHVFAAYRLSHNAGMLDVLIGQTAVMLATPLHTFNVKHYQFIPDLQTIQPYSKSF